MRPRATVMGAIAIPPAPGPAEQTMQAMAPTILAIAFDERGPVPNNMRFPALVYPQAFPVDLADLASVTVQRFEENGWTPAWRTASTTSSTITRKAMRCSASPRTCPNWFLAAKEGVSSASAPETCCFFRQEPVTAGSARAATFWWSEPTRLARAATFCAMRRLPPFGPPSPGSPGRQPIRCSAGTGRCWNAGMMDSRYC
jgi:hypothetical protein